MQAFSVSPYPTRQLLNICGRDIRVRMVDSPDGSELVLAIVVIILFDLTNKVKAWMVLVMSLICVCLQERVMVTTLHSTICMLHYIPPCNSHAYCITLHMYVVMVTALHCTVYIVMVTAFNCTCM